MMPKITFQVCGTPVGQPRPRAFARKMGNTFVARLYDAGTAEAWKAAVVAAGVRVRNPSPFPGAVSLSITFHMPRPKGHFRTGKHAGELRDNAPFWHTGKPDTDNLAKAVMDALTVIGGFWHDDAQVSQLTVVKHYALLPGANIIIQSVTNNDNVLVT